MPPVKSIVLVPSEEFNTGDILDSAGPPSVAQESYRKLTPNPNLECSLPEANCQSPN